MQSGAFWPSARYGPGYGSAVYSHLATQTTYLTTAADPYGPHWGAEGSAA